jgi:hypothetical protein
MRWIKYFEKFDFNQKKYDEVVKCIEKGGYIYAKSILNFPKNDPKEPLKALSIDEDGLITIDIDGKNYEVELHNVEKIDY